VTFRLAKQDTSSRRQPRIRRKRRNLTLLTFRKNAPCLGFAGAELTAIARRWSVCWLRRRLRLRWFSRIY